MLDMSTAMGQDVKQSAIQVGKALNDPIANLSALSKKGIQFSAEQKETIKNLVEHNKLSEAQLNELLELTESVGADKKKFCDFLNVPSFADILARDFEHAKGKLELKRAQK